VKGRSNTERKKKLAAPVGTTTGRTARLKSCPDEDRRRSLRSLHVIQSAFEGGDDADYGSAPERWGWFVVPLRMRGVKNYVIPIKSPAQAAGRLYRWWLGGGSAIQLFGD